MHGHDVRLRQELVQRHLTRAQEAAGDHVSEKHARSKTAEPRGHRRTHVAQPHDPDREDAQLAAGHLGEGPIAFAHPPVPVGAPAEQVEHGHDHPIGDRVPVVAGRIGDRDAELGGDAVVHGVEAHRRHLDQPAAHQPLEHRPVEPVPVPVVTDDQVGVGCQSQQGILCGRIGRRRHLGGVILEPAPDVGRVPRAEQQHAWSGYQLC